MDGEMNYEYYWKLKKNLRSGNVMANIHYFRKEEIDEDDKFLTVGGLMDILKDVNPQTRVFIRNVDEWGEKPMIHNSTDSWELSDGLITDVKRANINQVTNKEEYIIIKQLLIFFLKNVIQICLMIMEIVKNLKYL